MEITSRHNQEWHGNKAARWRPQVQSCKARAKWPSILPTPRHSGSQAGVRADEGSAVSNNHPHTVLRSWGTDILKSNFYDVFHTTFLSLQNFPSYFGTGDKQWCEHGMVATYAHCAMQYVHVQCSRFPQCPNIYSFQGQPNQNHGISPLFLSVQSFEHFILLLTTSTFSRGYRARGHAKFSKLLAWLPWHCHWHLYLRAAYFTGYPHFSLLTDDGRCSGPGHYPAYQSTSLHTLSSCNNIHRALTRGHVVIAKRTLEICQMIWRLWTMILFWHV